MSETDDPRTERLERRRRQLALMHDAQQPPSGQTARDLADRERRRETLQAMIDQAWDLLSTDHDPHWEGRAVVQRVIRVLEKVLEEESIR